MLGMEEARDVEGGTQGERRCLMELIFNQS